MAAPNGKSKKRSASSGPPPERPVFFVDRSLGRGVAEALRKAGVEAHRHDDLFAQNAPDEEWLREVGRRGWVVLTKDKMIRRRPLERGALLSSGVRAFVLTSAQLSGAEMAAIFIRNLPRIQRLAQKTDAPFVAKVTRGGVIELYRLEQ